MLRAGASAALQRGMSIDNLLVESLAEANQTAYRIGSRLRRHARADCRRCMRRRVEVLRTKKSQHRNGVEQRAARPGRGTTQRDRHTDDASVTARMFVRTFYSKRSCEGSRLRQNCLIREDARNASCQRRKLPRNKALLVSAGKRSTASVFFHPSPTKA
eukprot:579628-Pleurochrysis_carterae.AAC.1